MGLIAALRGCGLRVQPFKSGPDYIDSGFLTLAAGLPCRNLDTRMLDDATVRELYRRQAQKVDICIIEGVMGLFDGAGADDERGSAAHLSKVLGLPVILILNARGIGRSVAALAGGFADFDPNVHVAGCLLNMIGSDRHAALLTRSLELNTKLSVLGCIRRDKKYERPQRHLGLVPAWENDGAKRGLDYVVAGVNNAVKLDDLILQAEKARPLPEETGRLFPVSSKAHGHKPVIALARDNAFCFYYQDNLDLLEAYGARLVEFSPLSDEELPHDTAGIWLGGGYPELHAKRLSANISLIKRIRKAAADNMPIFGECGGYMYISQGIIDMQDCLHPMAGILPGIAVMGDRLASLGYCTATIASESVFGPAGVRLEGHVFHWAKMKEIPVDSKPMFRVCKDGIEQGTGAIRGNSVGSWLHVHFASNPEALRNFVASATKWQKENH